MKSIQGQAAIIGLLLAVLLTAVYSNHFNNAFHFDDSHSVVSNIYIRSLSNIPKFFTDASTISSLPQNQSYRPMMPLSYAIDYRLAGNSLDPLYFHLSTYLWYLALCVLLYLLFLHIFNSALHHRYNPLAALFAAAFFAFHTVSAETINYISARSDSLSTFWFVLGLMAYIRFPAKRRYHLYLLPVVVGVLFKPSALVFAPMLMAYVWLFEHGYGFREVFSIRKLLEKRFLLVSVPALATCLALYVFQGKMTPTTFAPGNTLYNYLITQPYVLWQYVSAFFLPLHLSADTDLSAFETAKDPRFIWGMVVLGTIILIAVRTSEKKEWHPVCFGLVWYLLALLPSSSIVPFAEVMNDHRMFFPNIGMVMAVTWASAIMVYRNEPRILGSMTGRSALAMLMVLILSGHAYGTRERNKVWRDGESLWYDVTVKSPNNGRGLMNYGLRMMELGNYEKAGEYYMRSLRINPNYSYLHTNLAILKSTQGKTEEAEEYFLSAIRLAPGNPEVYHFYGHFLNRQSRYAEARQHLEKAISLSPGHVRARQGLMQTYYEIGEMEKLRQLCEQTLTIYPGDEISGQFLKIATSGKGRLEVMEEDAQASADPDKWLSLSLMHYRAGNYIKCVNASLEAVRLKPDFAEAYNNICTAYNMLGNFDEAEKACVKALELKPDFVLAKGNLRAAREKRDRIADARQKTMKNPTHDNFINLSLTLYNEGRFMECIKACEEALRVNPGSTAAYNNICSAYNQLGEWEKAVKACGRALEIDPDFQLARNNMNLAMKQLKK